MNSEKKTVQLKLNSYLNTLYLETLLNDTHGSLAQTVSMNKVLFQTSKKKCLENCLVVIVRYVGQ